MSVEQRNIVEEEDYLEEDPHLNSDLQYIEHILQQHNLISQTPGFWRYQGLLDGKHCFTRPTSLKTQAIRFLQGTFEGQLPEDQRSSPATWHFIGVPVGEDIVIRLDQQDKLTRQRLVESQRVARQRVIRRIQHNYFLLRSHLDIIIFVFSVSSHLWFFCVGLSVLFDAHISFFW